MLIPVAGVSLLLALLADEERVFAMSVYQRAKDEGWLPEPGSEFELRVPRRWFHSHPHLVPPPFSWPSTYSVGIVQHPYRTAHVLLTVDNFLEMTSTTPFWLEHKAAHMREHYLPIAQAMLREEQVPNFPPPWLQIRYNDRGTPYISGHEGRHRALMARELGLKVLPVILVIHLSPRGWEYHRDTIEEDPVVKRITAGKPVWITTQDHGAAGLPPRYTQLVPRAQTGRELHYEMTRLRMTLDPSLRRR
jgi:hypothetical protein